MTNKTDSRSGLFVQMSVIRANELSVEPSFTNRTQLLSYVGILWKTKPAAMFKTNCFPVSPPSAYCTLYIFS